MRGFCIFSTLSHDLLPPFPPLYLPPAEYDKEIDTHTYDNSSKSTRARIRQLGKSLEARAEVEEKIEAEVRKLERIYGNAKRELRGVLEGRVEKIAREQRKRERVRVVVTVSYWGLVVVGRERR